MAEWTRVQLLKTRLQETVEGLRAEQSQALARYVQRREALLTELLEICTAQTQQPQQPQVAQTTHADTALRVAAFRVQNDCSDISDVLPGCVARCEVAKQVLAVDCLEVSSSTQTRVFEPDLLPDVLEIHGIEAQQPRQPHVAQTKHTDAAPRIAAFRVQDDCSGISDGLPGSDFGCEAAPVDCFETPSSRHTKESEPLQIRSLSKYLDSGAASNAQVLHMATFIHSQNLEEEPSYLDRIRMYLMNGCMHGCLSWYMSLKEPPRTGWAAQMVAHTAFETLCLIVIISNSLWIWHTTDASAAKLSDDQSTFGRAVELAFLAFYSLELGLKVFVHRLFFFIGDQANWNFFDLLLVFVSFLEQLALQFFEEGGGGGAGVDIKFLRILRVMKLTKVLRMVRVLKYVRNLRLFMASFASCGSTLFWAGLIIFTILILGAMFLVQALTLHALEIAAEDPGLVSQIQTMFGSVFTAMVTLLQCVSSGRDWKEAYDVVNSAGVFNGVVFILFILFFEISVWSIVTGIFVERTMDLAKADLEGAVLLKRQRDLESAKELKTILEIVDTDCSRTISIDEWRAFMHNPELREYFEVRGVDIKDVDIFYQMLMAGADTEEDADVDMDIFLAGCLRLKGPASSIDVHTLGFESKVMHRLQKSCFTFMEQRFNDIEQSLQRLSHGKTDRDRRSTRGSTFRQVLA
eukprot:TRINITY_DN26830_c0_g1_i2.p1 TRINITY_DN26830_c0_g1~~TRINITY_DN26830_c0_g1_i2.p1  ORF type:complete len:690 (-),score=119.38 TRINITY_DN26830_c0_g1_i2:517-2586(-)